MKAGDVLKIDDKIIEAAGLILREEVALPRDEVIDFAADFRWAGRVAYQDAAELIPRESCDQLIRLADKVPRADRQNSRILAVGLLAHYSPSQQASLEKTIGGGKLFMAAIADCFLGQPLHVCVPAIRAVLRASPDFIPSAGRVSEEIENVAREDKILTAIRRGRYHLSEHKRREVAETISKRISDDRRRKEISNNEASA